MLLVRHGESEANAAGRFAYRVWDPGLTPRGRRQAQQLADQLRRVKVSRLVSSPLRRALETLEPLARAHGLPIEVLPALAELNMGTWDGARLKDLPHQDPERWARWRRDPDRYPPPDGEALSAVGARVLAGLDTLRGVEGLVVAGTHADCVKGAIAHILGISGPASRRVFVPNGGQVLLRATDDGWRVILAPLVLPWPP